MSSEEKKKYPEGTTFNDWTICNEARKDKRTGKKFIVPVVRRWIRLPEKRPSFERYPAAKYFEIRYEATELEAFVIRLNERSPEEERTKSKVKIRHAFISDELVDNFLPYLAARIEGRDAKKLSKMMRKYCLNFFTIKLELADPAKWIKEQEIWCQALLNEFSKEELQRRGSKGIKALRLWEEGFVPPDSTVKKIVQSSNHFLAYLHKKKPEIYSAMKFEPVTAAQYRKLRARREISGISRVGRFIPLKHWEKIEQALPDKIRSQVCLAYYFGLRLAETMGNTQKDVFKDHFEVRMQLRSLPDPKNPERTVLKGRMPRKIPFWLRPARNCYKWLVKVQDNMMHKDTLGDEWRKVMVQLKMPYQFHDLRRTWITNCFEHRDEKGQPLLPGHIQLAAGHKSIVTTMKYKLDSRAFSEERYNPEHDVDFDEDE